MLTRCPHCQTHFRVTAEQLKTRQGKVRCGACQEIFDALDSLSDEALVPPAPPATAHAEENESRRPSDGTIESPAAIIAVESIPVAANESPASPVEPEPVPQPDLSVPELPAAAEPAAAEWEPVPVPPAAPRRWPWRVGSAALLLLGAAQLIYIFRTELAVISPGLRPTLAAGCELFGCTLPRPVRPELIGIETSDLEPAGNGLLLTAILKNRAPFEQDHPHLELTLTDTQDAALVRKVLTPADYLPAGQDPARGFAARGEIAIKLALAIDNVPAVGYRLYLFYP